MVVDVTRPRAQGYGASVGDDWFRLAPSPEYPVRLYTRDSLAQRQDDAGSPEENVLDLGYAFSRSNLTGGEGLDWYPRSSGEPEGATDNIRFWDSENISIQRPVSGDPYKLTLSPDVATFWAPGNNPADIGASRDALYVIEDTSVHRFDDLDDTTADDTDDITITLTQLAVGPDNSVAILDNTGDVWFKGSQTDTYLKVYDTSADGPAAVAVWYFKDRIIIAANDAGAADQGVLREIAPAMGGTPASPTVTPVISTFDTFEGECLALIDAGHALVAGYSDGSLRSYVPQTDTAGGTPVLTIRARTPVPLGEVPFRLGWNLGVLMVFTIDTVQGHTRLYTSMVLDERFDFVVGAMQLIRTWHDSVESVPAYTKNIVSTRDEVYFFIGEATNTWNLWRYDLVTKGVFRHAAHERSTPLGLTYFENKLVFADGANVVQESDTDVMPNGYVITPNITFGLNTPINWLAFITEVQNLTGGSSVELYRSDDPEAIKDPADTSWVLTDTISDPSQSGIERIEQGITALSLTLQVKINASTDLSTAPDVTRFATRGFPKHRDWICEVPINVSDVVTVPNRVPIRIAGIGDAVHATILMKDGAATELTVLDPPVTLRGVVDQIMEPTTYITDRGSQGKLCMLIFRGSRLSGTTTAQAQGDAGMGVAKAGIATQGIGQVGI